MCPGLKKDTNNKQKKKKVKAKKNGHIYGPVTRHPREWWGTKMLSD